MFKNILILLFGFTLGVTFIFFDFKNEPVAKRCFNGECVELVNLYQYSDKDRFIILNSIFSGVCSRIKETMEQYSEDKKLYDYLEMQLDSCLLKKANKQDRDKRIDEDGWFSPSNDLMAS